MKTCAREGCDVEFEPRTHNQIYHENKCTTIATNAAIMVKYHEERARKLGLKRTCKTCDDTLSRYNENMQCNACMSRARKERNQSVRNMLVAAGV